MTSRRALLALAFGLLATGASLAAGGGVFCAFRATQTSAADSFSAAPDFTAPATSAHAIGKAEGGVAGFIRPGGSYNLYAQAADAGNPASGIATVKANLSAITSGQTEASLSSGTFSFESTSYNRRGPALTAGSSLAAGTYSYSLTLTDAAGNKRTESGYTATVDATAPTASDVQTTNKLGNTAGRPELGDTIAFTFSEPPEPNSILEGWSGGSTSVTVRIDDNAISGNDRLQVFNAANKTQLPFGSVDLGRTDYVSASRTFGASGTASTMALSANTITITLGTQSGAGTAAAGNGSMVWQPSATATDRAGNPMETKAVSETGAADKDF